MSERTRCNYCVYQGFEKLAKALGHTVTVRPAPDREWAPEGVDVYVHPADYTPPVGRVVGVSVDSTGYGEWWAGWFASLPTQCCGE